MGASRATSRRNSSATTQIEIVAEKKSPQFHFCHCQNLTVPRTARLKLVHSSRLVQRRCLVSWWKKEEHCTQSRTHAMMHTIDYRFELSTVHGEENQLPVRLRQAKKEIFDPIPTVSTVCKTVIPKLQNSPTVILKVFSKISNSNKTVLEKVFEKSHFHQQ